MSEQFHGELRAVMASWDQDTRHTQIPGRISSGEAQREELGEELGGDRQHDAAAVGNAAEE